MSRIFGRAASVGAAVFLLASCGATGFDPDLRGWMPGALNTADAAARAEDDGGAHQRPNCRLAATRRPS